MAEGVGSEHPQIVRAADGEQAAERPLRGSVERSRSERTPERPFFPHAAKFRAATSLLIGFAIGALAVAAVILIGGKRSSPSVPWSSWQPADSGTAGAREIADHIAPLYRISGTDQLAVVTVVNLGNSTAAQASAATGVANQASSGLQVAVRGDPSSSTLSLLTGNTIAYNLCGIGSSNCTIGVGQPSTNRLLLLRREALELALYTFKYISSTQNVVAILPPGHTLTGCTGICTKPNTARVQPVNIALLFLHDELKPWLGQPLAATLPEQFPPTVDQMPAAPEAGLVEQITARGMFSENIEQAQDGSSLVVLTPLPPA
jgi:hypothetical protein